MRNSLEAVSHDIGIRSSPLVNSHQAYFLLLYEKLQDILPGLVRQQSSLAYMTYVERCKVTRILWQNYSTRTWLLPQTKFFDSQCLVNICMGHCKPDLSLTSDDASSSLSSSVCCRYSLPLVHCVLCWVVSLIHYKQQGHPKDEEVILCSELSFQDIRIIYYLAYHCFALFLTSQSDPQSKSLFTILCTVSSICGICSYLFAPFFSYTYRYKCVCIG